MEFQAKPRDAFNTNAWDLHFTEYKEESYYLSKIYGEYAVLTVNFFTNKDSEKFDDFLKDFFQELSKRNITRLIIDVRGNYGGDSFMAKELLSYLTEKQIVYIESEMPFYYKLLGFHKPVTPQEKPFHGEVVVLTDGAGFKPDLFVPLTIVDLLIGNDAIMKAGIKELFPISNEISATALLFQMEFERPRCFLR